MALSAFFINDVIFLFLSGATLKIKMVNKLMGIQINYKLIVIKIKQYLGRNHKGDRSEKIVRAYLLCLSTFTADIGSNFHGHFMTYGVNSCRHHPWRNWQEVNQLLLLQEGLINGILGVHALVVSLFLFALGDQNDDFSSSFPTCTTHSLHQPILDIDNILDINMQVCSCRVKIDVDTQKWTLKLKIL